MLLMEDAVAYMFTKAPADVAVTFAWLGESGFTVRSHRGGHDAPFGNVVVELRREDLGVKICMDRSQWTVEVAPPGHEYVYLVQLLTAMEGTNPNRKDESGPLQRQLPVGVLWRSTVPMVIAWIESGDRTDAIESAVQAWRTATKRHLNL
jgi:hypothetical protein